MLYCPKCKDPYDGSPIPLKASDGIMWCSGPDDDGACDFHFDPKTGQYYNYENRKPTFFWTLACLFSAFLIDAQRKNVQGIAYISRTNPGHLVLSPLKGK